MVFYEKFVTNEKINLLYIVPSIFYISACLVIGELHPFSRYEMYNSFPSNSFCISITDTNGNLMPVQKYFNYSSFLLLHGYSNVLPDMQKQYTVNDSIQYHTAQILLRQMLHYSKAPLPEIFQLRSNTFFYHEKRINIKQQVMCTYVADPER